MTKITHIQLRAARQALNVGIKDIATLLKVSKATISKAELGKTRDFLFKHNAPLISFFEKNNITFPNEYSIRFIPPNSYTKLSPHSTQEIMTRFQLKTARCTLYLSQQQLASITKIHKSVISRAELSDNTKLIKPHNTEVICQLKNVFLSRNIEFPDLFSIFFKKYIDNKSKR